MLSTLSIKIQEAAKAEIETLFYELGLWESRSHFVREAIELHIRKYWIDQGPRFER